MDLKIGVALGRDIDNQYLQFYHYDINEVTVFICCD